jgi:PEP-CTERM motif
MTAISALNLGMITLPVAAQSLAGFVQGLAALEIPEPGMMLLFGLSVGLLGLHLGGKNKDQD